MGGPAVSIIVPVYNAEDYLHRCLDSLLSQTLEDLEIIAVDDGSSDGSSGILDSYAGKDNRVKVIHVRNGGVSKARNLGLDVARGEYFGFVDSDDWVDPDMFEVLLTTAREADADVSVCGVYGETENRGKKVLSPKQAVVCMYTEPGFCGYSCNKLVRRGLLSENRYDEHLKCYEDLALFHRVFSDCSKVAWTDTPLYHYEKHADSATSDFHLSTSEKEGLKALGRLYGEEKDPQVRDAMDRFFYFHDLETAIDYVSHHIASGDDFLSMRNAVRERKWLGYCSFRQRVWRHIVLNDSLKKVYWFLKGKRND